MKLNISFRPYPRPERVNRRTFRESVTWLSVNVCLYTIIGRGVFIEESILVVTVEATQR